MFEALEHYMDANSLSKIQKTTGMSLVLIRCYTGVAELWFTRSKTIRRKIIYEEEEDENNNPQIRS